MSGKLESLPGAGERAFPRLGRYALIREIGRGGMGLVYEALDSELGRRVALKTMHPALESDPVTRPADQDRFVREARANARLRHPNIVTVYDAGLVDGRRYLAMELLQGKPLHLWWETPGLALPRKLVVLRDAALGLDHAHRQGVLHRDLKPANIFVADGDHPYVMDFGLSKCLEEAPGNTLTARGIALGTPAYMSPEQAQASKTIDGRSDVYSLGVILYETLAGQTPFRGDTGIEILVKAAQQELTPPSRAAVEPPPELDRALENICLKALAKRPEDRYPTALAFAEDLTRWLSGENPRVVPPTRSRLFAYRGSALPWRPLVAGATGAILVALLFQFSPWKSPSEPPAADPPKAVSSLLTLVDPARDAVSGEWSRRGDGLASGQGHDTLGIPFQAPDEYDLRVEFTRLEGTGDVVLVLTRPAGPFAWQIGDHYARFSAGRDHPCNVRGRRFITTGRRHVAIVRVRRDGFSAEFDGGPVTTFGADSPALESFAAWSLRNPAFLGLGSDKSPVAFHSVELRRVRGTPK